MRNNSRRMGLISNHLLDMKDWRVLKFVKSVNTSIITMLPGYSVHFIFYPSSQKHCGFQLAWNQCSLRSRLRNETSERKEALRHSSVHIIIVLCCFDNYDTTHQRVSEKWSERDRNCFLCPTLVSVAHRIFSSQLLHIFFYHAFQIHNFSIYPLKCEHSTEGKKM